MSCKALGADLYVKKLRSELKNNISTSASNAAISRVRNAKVGFII